MRFYILLTLIFLTSCSTSKVTDEDIKKFSSGHFVSEDYWSGKGITSYSRRKNIPLTKKVKIDHNEFVTYDLNLPDLFVTFYFGLNSLKCIDNKNRIQNALNGAKTNLKLLPPQHKVNVNIYFIDEDNFLIYEPYINNEAHLYFNNNLCGENSFQEIIINTLKKTYHEITHLFQEVDMLPLEGEVEASTVGFCYILSAKAVKGYRLSESAIENEKAILQYLNKKDYIREFYFYSDYGAVIAEKILFNEFNSTTIITKDHESKIKNLCSN